MFKKNNFCEVIESLVFCSICGGVLDFKEAMEIEEREKQEVIVRKNSDELMNVLMKDPMMQELLVGRITELGLGNKLKEMEVINEV